MSIWVQYNVTALGSRKAIGKFFNLDPEQDIHHIDQFEFSFGQKNIPGLRLDKLIEQNSDLVYLIEEEIECDSTFFLQRFDILSGKMQFVLINQSNSEFKFIKYNKRIMEEYEKQFPNLMEQHKNGRPYEWRWFFNDYEKIVKILNAADQYKDFEKECAVVDLEMESAEHGD